MKVRECVVGPTGKACVTRYSFAELAVTYLLLSVGDMVARDVIRNVCLLPTLFLEDESSFFSLE